MENITYTVTYWTKETKTVRASNMRNAAKKAGYTDAYQKRACIAEGEVFFTDGDAYLNANRLAVHNGLGDLCAIITKEES